MISASSGFAFNHIPQVTAAVVRQVEEAKVKVIELGYVEARAKAAVDTGAMRDGIEETPEGLVATNDHSGFVENGTAHMPAQPFMKPAAEVMRIALPAEVTAAVREATP